MNTKKLNPHAWFFAYVTSMENYNPNYEETIREGIVLEASGGVTGSLSELYNEYPALYEDLKRKLISYSADKLEKARKRLIAVLFAYLQRDGSRVQIDYVKTVACNAAKVRNFNSIPLNQLGQLYVIFGSKNTKTWSISERDLVRAALRKENMN